MDLAAKRLRDLLDVKVLDNGIIEISYVDGVPQRAAEVTNEVVRMLDRVNRDVRITKAKNTRVFIESRLENIEDSLASAEDSLTAFRLRNRAISLDEQTRAQIDIVAKMEGERLMAKTELELLKRSLTPDHPEVLKLADRVEGLRDGINQLELGGGSADSLGFLRQPLIALPEMALELARLMRTVKTHETVYELLTGQYEQARIEESKTTPTLSVLHYSSVPQVKYAPKRSRLVLLAAFVAAVISLLWVWLVEHLLAVRQRDPEQFAKLRQLLQGLWLTRISKRVRTIVNEK
jgi:capsule polysaccharide export protein KpsE/RkpR